MSTITTTTNIDALDIAVGDLLVNPASTAFGVFAVSSVIECTDADTDLDGVIVTLDGFGSIVAFGGESFTIVVG